VYLNKSRSRIDLLHTEMIGSIQISHNLVCELTAPMSCHRSHGCIRHWNFVSPSEIFYYSKFQCRISTNRRDAELRFSVKRLRVANGIRTCDPQLLRWSLFWLCHHLSFVGFYSVIVPKYYCKKEYKYESVITLPLGINILWTDAY
jgi:hypothetical protein